MTTLHPLSHGTPLSEFDIFSVPPTQLSVVNDLETEHRPLQIIGDDRLVQFEFTTAPNEYVKWTETELYIKLRFKIISAEKIIREDWGKFAPERNFMHSMIQSMYLSINGSLVSKSSLTYAYRAYIDNMIGYSKEAKEGHLSSVLWEDGGTTMRYYPTINENDKLDDVAADEVSVAQDGSTQARGTQTAVDKSYIYDYRIGDYFDMRGKLCLDLAQQGRAMLGGLKFKLELRLHSPESAFVILDNTKKMKIAWDISEMKVIVHRTIVSDGTLAAHMRALQHATAKYPITRHEVQVATLNPGLLDVMLDRVFTGQLPRRVLVGFVKAASFRGNFSGHNFYFEHLNINHLSSNYRLWLGRPNAT